MATQIPVFKSNQSLIRGKEFLMDPLKFTVEQSNKLGGFFRVPFYFRKMFILTDLEAIRHVLNTNQKNYKKSPAYDQLKQALGNGLVTSERDFWRHQRRLIQPIFYKNQMEGLFKTMGEVAKNYLENLALQIQSKEDIDLTKEMMNITADIVLKTLFSSKNPASQKEMYETMEVAQNYIMNRVTSPHLIPLNYVNGHHRRFKKTMKTFDANILNLIEERRNDPNPPADLLTMLLMARDEETGEGMNDKQLRDEAITLYSAGHETSANALSWTLFAISKRPDIIKKIREEVHTYLGDKFPTFENIRNLKYTQQVIEEGMRLYPPAYGIGRENIEADEIIGYKIPRKSIIYISIYAVHRNPKLWKNPEEFNPSRFDPEQVKVRPRLAYMPFGAGPRMCIGNHFAMMEMQLILAMWIKKFRFELDENHPIEPNPLITLKPKYGIKMKLWNA
ncbi:MAG: cytochrome P450 [Saprospiraceae bacterium]|nr:cytochrome P450 [Saprospiraceae bacterium]